MLSNKEIAMLRLIRKNGSVSFTRELNPGELDLCFRLANKQPPLLQAFSSKSESGDYIRSEFALTIDGEAVLDDRAKIDMRDSVQQKELKVSIWTLVFSVASFILGMLSEHWFGIVRAFSR